MKVKVGLIGSLDMLEFKSMKEEREKELDKWVAEEVDGDSPINDHAKELHPDYQELVVERIVEHIDSDAKSYILAKADGSKPAYFRAGQSLSLKLQIGDSFVTRSYSISSSPKDVEEGRYRITVKRKQNGFASNHILNTFTIGTTVIASAPYGNLYYEKFRDNENVVAVAGGSGITPFVSMAHAIQDGIENFNLTIIYGNNNYESILFKDELDYIQKQTEKVKVFYVLANETKEGYESGFITSSIISKYAHLPYSVFVSGPSEMHTHIKKQLDILHKPRKEVRYETLETKEEITKEFNYPSEAIGKVFKISVIQGPETRIIEARSDETLLVAFEKAGIKAPSKCRGGECGWCRSKLVVGNIYSSKRADQRRYIDKELNYIHPCCSYPVADCIIEVPSEYL